ncbi:hypothetical protein NUW54_g12911 [Trametes sanguinea]|uniref:Uncharacterized protein n=1 Tax=Trametes sanguinea TaxID=158606 RepID=A0ACC1MRR2_9APHY|nr:hypothetical protein NUW54_g12911 [Trametes sanguinea]
MVTKADQEKHHYTQQVDFAQLKSELQLMEKNELAMIKAENDRLVNDIEKLKQRLREEITRTQAGVRLDLNLEKGRMREESSKQELKIKEVDTRIEQEIAALRTSIQVSKATTLQYLVGFVTGCSALLMAYMRFRTGGQVPPYEDDHTILIVLIGQRIIKRTSGGRRHNTYPCIDTSSRYDCGPSLLAANAIAAVQKSDASRERDRSEFPPVQGHPGYSELLNVELHLINAGQLHNDFVSPQGACDALSGCAERRGTSKAAIP